MPQIVVKLRRSAQTAATVVY